jgi:uncharacterized protein YraI
MYGMIRMNPSHRLTLFLALIFTLSACTLPAADRGPRAWIDAPLNGSVLPLAPYPVVYHGGAGGGIAAIEFSINDEILSNEPNADQSSILVTRRYTWSPPAPGTYTLKVRTQSGSGGWSDFAVSVVTIGGAAETPTDTPNPLITETSSVTPSSTLLPPSACVPMVTFIQNANCRVGPGTVYEVYTSFLEGQTVPIDGQNEEGTWGWLRIPNSSDHCWSSASTYNVSCDIGALPVIAAPPTPTMTPGIFYDVPFFSDNPTSTPMIIYDSP